MRIMWMTVIVVALAAAATLGNRDTESKVVGVAPPRSAPVAHCTYLSAQPNQLPELRSFTHCGSIDADGRLQLTKEHQQALRFPDGEPACVYVGTNRVFFVAQDGNSSESLYFDSGCDYFTEGLARSPSADGIRFVDRRLAVAIPKPYAHAFPFHNGLAVVCDGLQSMAAGAGGQCGLIDRQGVLVVPLAYSLQEVEVHRPRNAAYGLNLPG